MHKSDVKRDTDYRPGRCNKKSVAVGSIGKNSHMSDEWYELIMGMERGACPSKFNLDYLRLMVAINPIVLTPNRKGGYTPIAGWDSYALAKKILPEKEKVLCDIWADVDEDAIQCLAFKDLLGRKLLYGLPAGKNYHVQLRSIYQTGHDSLDHGFQFCIPEIASKKKLSEQCGITENLISTRKTSA